MTSEVRLVTIFSGGGRRWNGRGFWLFAAVVVGLMGIQWASAEPVSNTVHDTLVPIRVIRQFGEVTSEMIDQLRTELWVLVPATKAGEPGVLLSPAEVIDERDKYPELVELAGNKMCSIQRLTLGAAPELIEVSDRYVVFFEGIVRGAWKVTLTRRLRQADEALKRLSRQTLARKVYVDEFEKRLGEERQSMGTKGEAGSIPGLEKNPIDSYLDEAEMKFGTP